MARVVKILKTLRNNWKKTVFVSGIAAYGVQWAKGKYEDSLVRKAYCLEAKRYGDVPILTGDRPRRITVFLNPAAQKGKAKGLFEKNVAPILYMAGMEVTVVKTEYEGQAKKYMDVIEDTDAIIVAGGDGTLLEVVTGLLRKKDEKAAKIPIGVVPVGYTNTLARALFNSTETDVKWMAESAIAIVRNNTKPVDVLYIQGSEDKSVYAVHGLDWGEYKNAENRTKRQYWMLGSLKYRWTYLMSALGQWPPIIKSSLSYEKPCGGCSRCWTPPATPVWRWWHFFLPPRIELPKKDYSKVENPECGETHSIDLSTMELSIHTQNCQKPVPDSDTSSLDVHIGPANQTKLEFIREGWHRVNGEKTEEGTTSIPVGKFTLTPVLENKEKESWFTIDSELFEVMPVQGELLRNKIRMFCLPVSQTLPAEAS